MTEDIEATQEDTDLINTAVMIGIIQGKMNANMVGPEAADEMYDMGFLGKHQLDNIANMMYYGEDAVGTQQMLDLLVTLMGNNVLVIDPIKFNYFFEINVPKEEGIQ